MDKSLPMVYPPAPWYTHEMGCYYQKPTIFMRIYDSDEQKNIIKHANLGRMYEALDAINRIPWRINTKILDIIEKVWEMGGNEEVTIPKRYYDYDDYAFNYQLKESRNFLNRQKI